MHFLKTPSFEGRAKNEWKGTYIDFDEYKTGVHDKTIVPLFSTVSIWDNELPSEIGVLMQKYCGSFEGMVKNHTTRCTYLKLALS
jgi:hypothetical protein